MKSETELLANLAGPDMQESLLLIYKNYCKGVLSYIVQHGGSEQDGKLPQSSATPVWS
jgi:hypothetical protein